MDNNVEQDCEPGGCWWDRRDISRRVLARLSNNADVLSCDLVCREWALLKAPLPSPVAIDGHSLQNPAAAPWLARNLCRVQRLVLRGDAAVEIDWSSATALLELTVSECAVLQQLPAGVAACQHLTKLHFQSCPLLRSLPEDLPSLVQLQQLWVLGTPTSIAVVPDSIGALTGLQDLRLHGCHMLQELPDAVGSLTSLTRLELDTDCDSPELPSLQLPSHLTRISSSISNLGQLRHLTLRGANQLPALPDVFEGLTALLELRLVGLHAITTLPDSIGSLPALTCLLLHGANALEALPASIGGLGSLVRFRMEHCHKLASIPSAIAQLDSLEHLVLGCHSLMESLPDALGGLSSLTHLTIETASLPYLPDSVGHLGSLRELVLSYCHCLQTLPESIGGLSSLELLSIDTCMHLVSLPDTLTRLEALTELRLHNGEPAWPIQLPALPQGIGSLPNLRILSLTSQQQEEEDGGGPEGAGAGAGGLFGSDTMPALPASLAASSSLQEVRWGNLHLRRV